VVVVVPAVVVDVVFVVVFVVVFWHDISKTALQILQIKALQ